jgi:hypothetical protein
LTAHNRHPPSRSREALATALGTSGYDKGTELAPTAWQWEPEVDPPRAHPVDVAKFILVNYQDELQGAGDLFYTWRHEVQSAFDDLRREGKLLPKARNHKGRWRLA